MTEDYPVGATATTVRVIEALAEGGEMGVTELARELDLSKSAVYKHLATLERLEYVIGEEGRYRLGLGFLSVGLAVRDRLPLYRLAASAADDLAGTAGEITTLVVSEHGRGVYAYQAEAGREPPEWLRTGGRVRLHATAGGKAILAHLPDDRVEEILERHGLPALTEKTQTDRDRGLAFDRGEHRPDWRCVAAPILAEGDRSVRSPPPAPHAG